MEKHKPKLNQKPTARIKFKLNTNGFLVIATVVMMLLLAYTGAKAYYLAKQQQRDQKVHSIPVATFKPNPTYIPTPSPQPTSETKTTTTTNTQGNQITCIGPDDKQFLTTMDACKSLNEKWGKPVDYLTSCTFPVECGGGTKVIRKSQCDIPCKRLSGTTNTNTYTPTQYTPCTVYYPILGYSQTYNYMTTEACNKAKADAATSSTAIPPDTAPTSYPSNTNNQPTNTGLILCSGPSTSGGTTQYGELTFKECCNKLCDSGYEIAKISTYSQYGGSTGTADFIIKSQIDPQYQSCLASCN